MLDLGKVLSVEEAKRMLLTLRAFIFTIKWDLCDGNQARRIKLSINGGDVKVGIIVFGFQDSSGFIPFFFLWIFKTVESGCLLDLDMH